MVWVVVAIVVALFAVGRGDPVEGLTDILAGITRGSRLTRCDYDASRGLVLDDPLALAQEAGASLDEYALARMISSEHGSDTNLVKAAVAAAAVNYAARSSSGSIASVLLRAKNPDHDGYFGAQQDFEINLSNGKHPSDRYASTRADPYTGDLAIARGILDGSIGDPTGGATNFDVPRGETDPDAVAAKRIAGGLTLAEVEGIDSNYLRFWRPA